MKKLFALLAVALTGFGVAIAAEPVVTPEQVKAGAGDPYDWLAHEVAQLSIEEAKAQLESIADAVKESDAWTKNAYATALTAIYSRENPAATYEQLLAEQTKNLKALGIGEPKGTERFAFVLKWWRGDDNAPKSVLEAAYEANKDVKGQPAATLCILLGKDFETEVVPRYEAVAGGRNWLFNYYGNHGNWERSAKYFWGLLNEGALNLDWAIAKYPQILNYELGKEDFDAAELKAKLTRGILVYKAKARTWKGKEGESNPFIEFVGMLQDTAKDL